MKFGSLSFKDAGIRALIVLIPSYAVAYLTDKMVYVVPTLAAASIFASSLAASDLKKISDGDDADADDADEGVDGSGSYDAVEADST